MNDHPNGHIRAAVDYAIQHGWTLQKAGPRAHIWGRSTAPDGTAKGASSRCFRRREFLRDTPSGFGEKSITARMQPLPDNVRAQGTNDEDL